jgi:hypothetical protein
MATMPCNALHIAHAPWGGTYISITLPQCVAGVCNEILNTPSMPLGANALYIFYLPRGARPKNPDQIFDTPSSALWGRALYKPCPQQTPFRRLTKYEKLNSHIYGLSHMPKYGLSHMPKYEKPYASEFKTSYFRTSYFRTSYFRTSYFRTSIVSRIFIFSTARFFCRSGQILVDKILPAKNL